MYRLGKNIPVIRFLRGSINIPGAVEPFICDLHRLSGNFIAALHFLDDLPDIRFFRFISGIHLHGHRHQVCIQKERLSDDWVMPVFFGRAFLLILIGQVDLEIIIRTVKKYIAEIPLIVLLIAMVKEFDIFFIGSADKR